MRLSVPLDGRVVGGWWLEWLVISAVHGGCISQDLLIYDILCHLLLHDTLIDIIAAHRICKYVLC